MNACAMNLGMILVVWVLGGHFVQLTHNGDLLPDGGLNLRHEGRVFHKSLATSSKGSGKHRKLTALAGRGVDAREEGLGGGSGALETLDDLGEGVADSSLLVQFVLEIVKD